MTDPIALKLFATSVGKMDDGELFDAAAAVDDLDGHAGFVLIERLVAGVRDRALARLIHGPTITEPGQAARDQGFLSGLETALAARDAIITAAKDRASASIPQAAGKE